MEARRAPEKCDPMMYYKERTMSFVGNKDGEGDDNMIEEDMEITPQTNTENQNIECDIDMTEFEETKEERTIPIEEDFSQASKTLYNHQNISVAMLTEPQLGSHS